METRSAPGLYLDPPTFDIELEEFGTLPMCRLEAIRLLREGQTAADDEADGSRKALTADARLLLLHGHGDRPSEAKHRRADLASHFILKLACCGGSSSNNNNRNDGVDEEEVSLHASGKNRREEQREEESDWREGRREWFVRAERYLFEARLHWHLRQTEDADEGGAGEKQIDTRTAGARRNADGGGDGRVTRGHRLDALRIVYNLGWLQPVVPATARHDGVGGMGASLQKRARGSGSGSGSGSGGGGGGSSGGCCSTGGRNIGKTEGRSGSSVSEKRRRGGDDPFREENPPTSCLRIATAAAVTATATATAVSPGGGTGTMTMAKRTTKKSEDSPAAAAAAAKFQPSAVLDGGYAGCNSYSDMRYTSCPFEKVIPLVRSRRVLLRNGKALLSQIQVPEAVVLHFEERLREGLAVAQRGLPGVEADGRVAGVLRRVRRAVDDLVCGGGGRSGGGRDGDNRSSATITRRNIDRVAAKHFPLCMRRTLRVLRREHHLKYQARLQLIAFLGNAGMEVGELLGLWREEFPKGMPADEYARKRNQYEYSLRHLYGLEGKRKAYRPQSCARIASLGWGGSGDGGNGHGCPFHSLPTVPGGGGESKAAGSACGGRAKDTSVRGMLTAQNLPTVDIEDIVGSLESGGAGGGAQGACRRHYAATHRLAAAAAGAAGGWRTGGTGSREASPNGWLAASTRSSQRGLIFKRWNAFPFSRYMHIHIAHKQRKRWRLLCPHAVDSFCRRT
ncbi:unnamed protein product [Pylaiella littoralis]